MINWEKKKKIAACSDGKLPLVSGVSNSFQKELYALPVLISMSTKTGTMPEICHWSSTLLVKQGFELTLSFRLPSLSH